MLNPFPVFWNADADADAWPQIRKLIMVCWWWKCKNECKNAKL